MKATITRIDHEKEEATVILLDAPYQLPVTVDANYLKPSTSYQGINHIDEGFILWEINKQFRH